MSQTDRERLSQPEFWLRAIGIQGKRVFEIVAQMRKADRTPSETGVLQDFRRTLNDKRVLERHFFAITVNQAIDWLETVKGISTTLDTAIEEFFGVLPKSEAQDVRDMSEHNIPYAVTRTGHRQARFMKTIGPPAAPNISGTATFAATADNITDTDYYLGGRLGVYNAMKAADELLLKIERCRKGLERD